MTIVRKRYVIYAAVILLAVVLIQFWNPDIERPPVTGKIAAPAEVIAILDRSCSDCHSNEPRLRWYDKLAPASWLVASDIRQARSRFNLSTWDSLTVAEQHGELWEMVNMAISGKMPLRPYALVHPSADISAQDIAVLKRYVLSLSTFRPGDTAGTAAADRQFDAYRQGHAVSAVGSDASSAVPTAADGVSYLPNFQTWQVISTTNRFDYLPSIRVVYGNDIAAKAIRDNRIDPWPDGSTIVKVVWDITEDTNGNIGAASFNNVQMMTKDDKRFPDTKGWGFAKFDGLKLVPFGAKASFNTTCYNCHRLAGEYGYVFNVPPVMAAAKRDALNANGLEVITTFANRKQQTMSTLYGNKTAREMALAGNNALKPGAVFLLVTWDQADSKYWYGSLINGSLQSVESLKILPVLNGDIQRSYHVLHGEVSKDSTGFVANPQSRIDFILAQRPSVFPQFILSKH